MELDPFMLARMQFAANISFHILFPTITIGLCWILLYFRSPLYPVRGQGLGICLFVLGEDLCPELCAGGGVRYHHEFPVRHQLARVYGAGREYCRAAARL